MQAQLQAIFAKLKAGDFVSAAKQARQSVKKYPKEPAFRKFAGVALRLSGRPKEALKFLAEANKATPGDLEIRQHLIGTLVSLDQTEKANSLLSKWLDASPTDVQLSLLAAGTQLELGSLEAALGNAQRAIAIAPENTQARSFLALILFEMRNFREACAEFEKVTLAAPMNAEAHGNYGSALNELHRFEDATAAFGKAVKLAPENVDYRYSLALLQSQLAQFEAAKRNFQRIIKTTPAHDDSISSLVEISSEDEIPSLRLVCEKALKDKNLSEEQRAAIELSLAKALLKQGKTDAALEQFQVSNVRRARALPYDRKRADADFKAALNWSEKNPTSFESHAQASSITKIFVIGMPRSGTTLAELMISNHSRVQGLGEFGINTRFDDFEADPIALASHYVNEMPDLPAGTQAVVDKTPGQYETAGKIAECFPEARFINICRDPREIAFSMWQRHLSGWRTYYTSDMRWIAHALNNYRKYTQLWETQLGQRFVSIKYADLVKDPEAATRHLASFCDLEWEPAMARPETNPQSVATASISEVRSEIHTRSLGKWRAHADLMRPLVDNLDPDLWPDLD
ncbi:Flp pilus assembly protein TadD [Shimia isoporae]|uniref:Flp pilus assembly protein TadD n=1 Tax=Shimia isoporae TaxID=647720 RepID=A0A4R1NUY3_9RHOB|nr:tetratricopeptide repeat-containing sulfotransferase family protein [Shimia isoporae]TCL08862.1 Flp pilus assembly protein TadD [Shimia isoporae]